jgi:hypothetical protein
MNNPMNNCASAVPSHRRPTKPKHKSTMKTYAVIAAIAIALLPGRMFAQATQPEPKPGSKPVPDSPAQKQPAEHVPLIIDGTQLKSPISAQDAVKEFEKLLEQARKPKSPAQMRYFQLWQPWMEARVAADLGKEGTFSESDIKKFIEAMRKNSQNWMPPGEIFIAPAIEPQGATLVIGPGFGPQVDVISDGKPNQNDANMAGNLQVMAAYLNALRVRVDNLERLASTAQQEAAAAKNESEQLKQQNKNLAERLSKLEPKQNP